MNNWAFNNWAFSGLLFLSIWLPGCATPKPLAKSDPSPTSVHRSYYLMGTSLEIEIYGMNRADGMEAADAAFEVVQADEKRLSTWIKDSELSQANRAAVGEPFALSPLLARDLSLAFAQARATDFAFTPWIGPLVRAWGLRVGGKIPSPTELETAREASQPNAFLLSGHDLIKQLPGALVEEGGFGKGIGLDDAAEALKGVGVKAAVLNFGGQVLTFGMEGTWVEVANPEIRGETLLKFSVPSGSISTSGNSEHGMEVKEPGSGKIRKSGISWILKPEGLPVILAVQR